MGRVGKGQKCSVSNCDKEAIRSLPREKVSAAGLKVDGEKTVLPLQGTLQRIQESKQKRQTARTMETQRLNS